MYKMENSAVFVSYETSDYDHLRSFLFKPKDYRVYSAKAARLPGQQGLAVDTVQAIKLCQLFVVCLSQNYAASSECMLEAEYAANIRKKIIVLAIDGVDTGPASLFYERERLDYSNKSQLADYFIKGSLDNLESKALKNVELESRYKLVKLIGEGNQAFVYQVKDSKENKM